MFIVIVVSLLVGVVAGALLDRKYGKQVGIRIGDIEAKGRTVEEVARVFEQKAAAKLEAIKKVL